MQQLPQNHNIYQVYFFTCPAHKPFHVARHPWIVTVSPDGVHRWEIIHKQVGNKERFGYLYKNYYNAPTQGLKKSQKSLSFWDSELVGYIEGENNSLAQEMVAFINASSKTYIHKDKYVLYPGPNSNTYVQWVLDHFPESQIKLPWNCIGKKYK